MSTVWDRHLRRGIYESAPADRIVASIELERATKLEAELRELYASCARQWVLDLLMGAIVNQRAAEEHYRYLHRPARPYSNQAAESSGLAQGVAA